MKKIYLFLSLVLAVLCGSCAHVEPDVFGKITGIVKDANTSAPLDGVKVTITTTGASQITTSDGQFMFESLDAIEYTMTFEKTGYTTATQTVKVLAGETTSVHVQLHKNLIGISVSPTMLDFGTNENTLNLTLTSTSGQSVYFDAGASDSWLSVSPQSGTVSANGSMMVQVMVSRTGAPGNYQGMITFRVNSETLSVPVYMRIAGGADPVITVESITGITQTTATVAGLLTLEDGVSVSDYGICYSTNAQPTLADKTASRGSCSHSTNYTCQLSGLNAGTEYYVRAYAVSNGTTYYGNTKSFTTATNGGGGGGTEDYSSAIVKSDNYQVEVSLTSCRRSGGTRVTIEATLLNKGINPYTSYYIYQNNYGYTLNNYSYTSHVEDDLLTTYGDNAVTKYLSNKNSNYGLSTQLPVNATRVLKVTIDGVPEAATRLSLYLASEFQNTSPREYAYLTFENVPIY